MSKITIHDIPLDAWVVILRFISRTALIDTFNKLFYSRIINVPLKSKLETFWIVISQARYLDAQMEEEFAEDVQLWKKNCQQLVEMGIEKSSAVDLLRKTNGDIQAIFVLLGWT